MERAFGQGRRADLDATTTLQQYSTSRALRIMNSEQVDAFDIHRASLSQRAAYGETPFGRGCLVAMRLIEAGVRCVKVTLGGWDTPKRPVRVEDLHATIQHALGMDPIKELVSPVGRPLALSEGKVIRELLTGSPRSGGAES